MKRYYQHKYGDMVEDKERQFDDMIEIQWVKADIAEELYEVVVDFLSFRDSIVPDSVFNMAERVLKKARGETK